MTSPFYFAWVYESERTFGSQHEVLDEDILSFNLMHEEGQIPTLDIVVKNPRIGLLNPGRKVWAWFSWQGPSSVVPLFFGVLLGVPTNIFAEKVTLKFLARSPTYIEDKQAVAETMKVAPFYDGVFLDDAHRDEPDAILEGWSKLWHVDRTTLATTASDILVGEDGTAQFYGVDDAFYKSLKLTLGQPPLNNVRVEATVQWTQRAMGYITCPTLNVASYTGDTFMSDWPKPGANIGGGYSVEFSYVADIYHVLQTPMASTQQTTSSWGDVVDYDCAITGSSLSMSWPALMSPNPLNGVLVEYGRPGFCDPYGDPPINQSSSEFITGQIVPLWMLTCDLLLKYDAKRQFTEFLAFDLVADTQAVLTSPTVQQNTELISISGANVGEPLEQIDAWSDFAGQHVDPGTIIFPNDPTTPGGLAHQVCTIAGTAGTVEPVFSDIPGTVVVDGTVHWASMGLQPLTQAPDWLEASFVPLGEIICYQQVQFQRNSGQFEKVPNATTYYLCTSAGETNSTNVQYSYVPPTFTSDSGTPAPAVIDHIFEPTFTTTPGAQITDGTVVWTCLGASPAILQIPIGGTPDNVTGRCYFPTDRGDISVQYLIAKARARLRIRSRAVKVEWDCPFSYAVSLSCRMNATLRDPRLPGGITTGKITKYVLTGDKGKFRGHIEIGVAVGRAGAITTSPGTGSYAGSGYAQSGYQLMLDLVESLPSADIAYTRPAFVPFDDGVSFPILNVLEVTSTYGEFSMTAAAQAILIRESFPVAAQLAWNGVQIPPMQAPHSGEGGTSVTTTGFGAGRSWYNEQQNLLWASKSTPYVMEANPVSWTCYFKPLTNGPYQGSYAVAVSPLIIPKGIDLEAASAI